MQTRYDALISVKVEHKYFADLFFDAFELTPDEKTRQAIQRLGLLTKKIRNNWFLLYQSAGPWKTTVDALLNREFTFMFDIKDGSFAQYTDDEHIPKPEAIQFYAAAIDGRLFSSSRYIEPPVFDYSIQNTDRPVNIRLKQFKGEVLKEVTVIESSVKTWPFDVTASGEQPYDISENTLPITEEKKREIFVYKDYVDSRFYGMIYFKVLPLAAGGNTNKYNLVFEKK